MQMLYVYKSHIGGHYCVPRKLEDEQLICSLCEGVDEFVGTVDTEEEAAEKYKWYRHIDLPQVRGDDEEDDP